MLICRQNAVDIIYSQKGRLFLGSGESVLMNYVICQLCRAKVTFPGDAALPERCTKCQSKLPRDAEIHADNESEAAAVWICPSCLGRLSPQITSADESTCPICGESIDNELAASLGSRIEAIITQPLAQLLKGDSCSSVAAGLQNQGITSEQAWRCVDRLIAELPFERQRLESQGESARLAPSCDACGISGDTAQELSLYDAEWVLNPDELKRYRQGYAGFDGQFADSQTYTRKAVYCLCKKCYKRSGKDDFADGYPRKFGFKLKRIKKRK